MTKKKTERKQNQDKKKANDLNEYYTVELNTKQRM